MTCDAPYIAIHWTASRIGGTNHLLHTVKMKWINLKSSPGLASTDLVFTFPFSRGSSFGEVQLITDEGQCHEFPPPIPDLPTVVLLFQNIFRNKKDTTRHACLKFQQSGCIESKDHTQRYDFCFNVSGKVRRAKFEVHLPTPWRMRLMRWLAVKLRWRLKLSENTRRNPSIKVENPTGCAWIEWEDSSIRYASEAVSIRFRSRIRDKFPSKLLALVNWFLPD